MPIFYLTIVISMVKIKIFFIGQGRYIHMDVNAVQQRPGYFGAISMDLVMAAVARMFGVGEKPAGAGVHGGDEHKIGRNSTVMGLMMV